MAGFIKDYLGDKADSFKIDPVKAYPTNYKECTEVATNAGWLDRTFKEIENYCDVKKELNIQFAEDYREHKCLTLENEIDEWINSIKE